MKRRIKGVWLLFALCNLILPSVRVMALSPGDLLTPVGRAVTIELCTEGVIVAGLGQVETGEGERSPAREAGIRVGDRITAVNGRPIRTGEEFLRAVEELADKTVYLTVCRNGADVVFGVEPVTGEDGAEYLGLWLRSSISGIGTVTFQDPLSGVYGALGHGVCMENEQSLTPVSGGMIGPASISDVVKGEKGAPGELVGVPENGEMLGSVEQNTDTGIFGRARIMDGEALPAAEEGEIRTGEATIRCNVQGQTVEDYTVEIVSIHPAASDGRQLALKVTDERLLSLTGGIVQGMSGSPILQNGKLVGAVTHVLVEDPTRGYGVCIDRMLSAAA